MWTFNQPRRYGVELDPTEREFFVNNQTDRSSALIRETIQNSLDARRSESEIVTVRFSFHDAGLFMPTAVMDHYLEGLMPHLRALEAELRLDEVDFGNPRFLVIEDFGTHGLRGDPESTQTNDFFYFWRVVGRSGKGDGKGGRWGLGKTVFPNSSEVSAFFGYTVQSDTSASYLFGQAALKTHQLNGVTYLPYAFFTKSGPGEWELPFSDDKTTHAFARDFKLTRVRGSSGLSIVVPFPFRDLTEPSLLEAAILHYFFPILAGKLVVQVNDRILNQSTITRVAAEMSASKKLRDIEKSISFAQEIQNTSPNDTFVVDFPDQLNTAAGRVSRTAFTRENLDAIRRHFNERRLVSVRIPVEIRPRTSEVQSSFFTVFLKKDPTLTQGMEFYIRGGISITGHQTFGGRQAYGLLLAEDAAVSKLLGDAENPAHTAWQATSQRIAARYHSGRDTLLFIRESMVSLLDTLIEAGEDEYADALVEFFYTPRARKQPTSDTETAEAVRLKIESDQQSRVEIAPLHGGFKLKYSGNGESGVFPLRVAVLAAYEIRHGDPFKNYHPDDFDLSSGLFAVHHKHVRNLTPSGQRLEFVAESRDFEVTVTGFDFNRDLKLRVDQRTDR